jgi:hypothetical protein
MPTRLNGYAGIPSRQSMVVAMKVLFILASLIALAPMVRADTVVVRHEPTVVVHENERHYVHHYHHHYSHYSHHDDTVVVHHG